MHQNIEGLLNKELQIGLFLEEANMDVLCFTESWLKEHEMLLNFGNYCVGSFFCRKKMIRGGSLILVNRSIKFKRRTDIENFSVEHTVELACVELEKHIIVSIYRPPIINYFKTFLSVIDNVMRRLSINNNKSLVAAGDFNVDLLVDSTQKSELVSLFQCYNLAFQFLEPTRITSHSATCIDNIFCDCPVNEKTVLHYIKSDHKGQFIEVTASRTYSKQIVQTRRVTTQKIDQFHLKVSENLAREFTFDNFNPNSNYNKLFDIILNNFNDLFPAIDYEVKSKLTFNDWATKGVRTSRDRMYELYYLKSINTSDTLASYIRQYSKTFKLVCKQAKSKYLAEKIKISKNTIKSVWSIIKAETGQTDSSTRDFELRQDSKIVNDKHEIANTFNEYFANIPYEITKSLTVSPELAINLLSDNVTSECTDEFRFHHVSAHDILKFFKSLKLKSSEDLWGMSVRLVNNVIKLLAPHLSLIFNSCIDNKIFPDLMKYSKIIPLFKSGKKTDPSNFRPVSILPVLSKIYEKIMLNQLVSYFNARQLLFNQQYGFSKGCSTTDAVVNFVEYVYESWEISTDVLGVFCDLSKAFDCVNHKILISKLRHYGVKSDALALIESYLSKRKQSVDINGALSNALSSNIGVPQGSILGPFLFLVYINDLPFLVKKFADIVLFADDTSLLFRINRKNPDISMINSYLNVIDNWFNVNNLMLNSDKTKCIKFTLARNIMTVPVQINNNKVDISNYTKFLGITIDAKLQWGKHIDILSGKLSSAAYAVYKIRDLTDIKTARLVYYSYFHSLMSYGLLLWGNSADSNKIFVLQKRAVRAIYRLGVRDSLRLVFKDIGIITMPSLYIYLNIMYARKHILRFCKHSDSHQYDTRFKNRLVQPITRFTKVNKSFVVNCIRFYNTLPEEVTKLNERMFKNIIKKTLQEKAYYCTKDFLSDKDCWKHINLRNVYE